MNSEELIEKARKAGAIVRATHNWASFCRAWQLPRVLAKVCAARRDGTLTAAERAYRVGRTEGERP